MADLIYHNLNFFSLVDGNGNSIDIDEPINWDKILINVEFTSATNTYSVEFTDKDVMLEFDEKAGKSFIENIYDTLGIDGILIFQFGQTNPGNVREVLYTGQANFSNYVKSFAKVSFNMERKSLGDNFMNRYSIKTNLNLAKSLSGVVMPVMQQLNVKLHTKLLSEHTAFQWDTKSDPDFPVLVFLTTDDGSGFHYNTLAPPFIFNGTSPIADLQEPIEPDGKLIYSGVTLPPGILRRVLNFTWNFSGDAIAERTAGGITIYFGFKIYKKINISTGGTSSISDGLIAQELTSGEVVLNDRGSVYESQFAFAGSGQIFLTGDDAIFIRFYFRSSHSFPVDPDPAAVNFFGIGNPFVLNVDESVSFAPTLAKGVSIFDAINQQIGLITDIPNSLRSNYLTRGSGCLGNRIMLSGKMLRGFTDFDSGIVLSSQDWYQAITALTPIGMNIERDNSDNQFLRVEDIAYYFANVRLLSIAIIDLDSYKKSCDPSIIYNQIQAGYAKQPSSGQTNSLESWMGSFTYSTPILRIANALNIVSQFILNPYYIELARRLQAIFDSTVTYETDQDNYLLHDTNTIKSSASVTGAVFDATNKKISFAAIDTGICLNDQIIVSGSSSNNKTFTVLNFEEDISIGTIIVVREAVVNETASITITFSGRYECKKNEDFDSVVGIFSPETTYNLIHHVIRMVIAWAKVWRSGMSEKPNDSKITYTAQANNSNLVTILKSSVTCRFGDDSPSGTQVFDGGNGNPLTLQYLDAPLFTKNIIEFKCQLTWEVLKVVRMAFEGRHPTSLNYGYIEITNPDGVIERGWVLSLKFQPVTLTCTFQLREKFNG